LGDRGDDAGIVSEKGVWKVDEEGQRVREVSERMD
jgi:hypothetical protein